MAVFAENNKFLGIHALSLTQSRKDLLNNNSNNSNKMASALVLDVGADAKIRKLSLSSDLMTRMQPKA